MTGLKQLQEKFQRGILAGDDKILSEIKDSAKEERKTLFGVYRYAYVARLAEILADDYEGLHGYVGDARFAKLAKAYIAAYPSDRRSVRDFGRHVPKFLSESELFPGHPELAEIAALEKALADAFDGPDAEPLGLTVLSEVPPEAWPRLVFTPHPTVLRLAFSTNADAIWSAVREEMAPPKATVLPERQIVLVWRQDVTARFRPLGPEEAMMWDEAVQGTRFGVLCEMVATFAGEDGAELRAASYLKNWIEMGMLAGYRVEEPPACRQ
ncbi:MAG: DNA-binding domain-containing protein [Methyloceanibacter sp.]